MHMVIQFHPYYYPNNLIQAQFIGTLLLKMTLTWFAPLLECQSSFLNDIKKHIHEEFNATFGDSNKECASTNKLLSFFQRSH
jgi:hypothetical protein